MPVDPYGRDNPLGPRAILSAYNQTFTAIETGRADALLIATQEQLDLTKIDAGLAVTVAAHQRDLKRQSYNFGELVEPDYIGLVVALDNLLELLGAVDAAYARPSADPDGQWDEVTRMLNAIAETAGETAVTADAAVDHLGVVNHDIARISGKLDAALKAASKSLDAKATKSLARVEELTKDVFENIQSIVEGAQATGDAFTDFGIGVLTTIADQVKPDDKKKDEKKDEKKKEDASGTSPKDGTDAGEDSDEGSAHESDAEQGSQDQVLMSLSTEEKAEVEKAAKTKNSDGGVPDVTFVVSAIKAGFKGTEKYAAALKDLKANNDLLAAEYQKIAATNRLIAVASATQSQKNLYLSSMEEAQTGVTTIRHDWGLIRNAYLEWSRKTEKADRDEFARLHRGAMAQWKKLAPEVERIRRQLVYVRAPKLV